MFWNLFTLLRPRSSTRRQPAAKARVVRGFRRPLSYRPTCEALEGRELPATLLTPAPGLSGFVNPVLLTNAADGSNRLFVVEQRGRILVQQPGGGAPTVFLDISQSAANAAHRRVLAGGEQGLLGLAFHPNFETNGLFYIHHTRTGLTNTNDIVEYHIGVTSGNVADPNSERLLLRIPQNASNHNGGSIEFGPDGFLYIGKGDGGGGDDPANQAQNINLLLGKILRIDVNRDDFPADPNRNYGIPADNPYVGVSGADEIFALGLRNPYRFSFDRGTGQLYVGDVGQNWREEIDIVTRGGNYGWRAFEGNGPNPSGTGGPPQFPAEVAALQGIAIPPITDLDRSLARSITGGYVYRGTQGTLSPGAYLFGDFILGNIFRFHNPVRTTELNAGFNISSFGEDEAGELYVVNYAGSVLKVVGTNQPPVLNAIGDQTVPSSQDVINVPLVANDPDGDAVSFTQTAQSEAYVLDQQLGLSYRGSHLDDWGHRGEKWLQAANGDWYFIVPSGELYRWDGSGASNLTGTLVGTPGASYHANVDLLSEAVPNQPHAALSIAGNTLTIDREDGFIGAVVVTVTASDGRGGTDSETFTVIVTPPIVPPNPNQPPVLDPISSQTVPSSQDILNVPLVANDPDGDPVTFSATAQSLAYVLDQQLGLSYRGSHLDDWGHRGEKWLQAANGDWYFILPNGELYRWDGSGASNLTGTLVGTPGASYHANVDLLGEAVPNQPHAALSIAGNTLTIDREDGFIGAIVVTATASDGRGGTDSEMFTVTVTLTVTPNPNQPPVLDPINSQTVPSSQDVINVPLSANDADGDPVSFSATAQSLAYVLDQQLGLAYRGSHLDDWGNRGEKWLQAANGDWHFILPNGELYRWDGSGASNLTGTLVGTPGASYHANVDLLGEAVPNQPHAALSIAGNTLIIDREDGFIGAIVVTVTASDGRGGTDSELFTVTVLA